MSRNKSCISKSKVRGLSVYTEKNIDLASACGLANQDKTHSRTCGLWPFDTTEQGEVVYEDSTKYYPSIILLLRLLLSLLSVTLLFVIQIVTPVSRDDLSPQRDETSPQRDETSLCQFKWCYNV